MHRERSFLTARMGLLLRTESLRLAAKRGFNFRDPKLEIGSRKFNLGYSARQVANCGSLFRLELAHMGFQRLNSRSESPGVSLQCLNSRRQLNRDTHLCLQICEQSHDVSILHCEYTVHVDIADELPCESFTQTEYSHACGVIICAHHRGMVWSVADSSDALTVLALAKDASPGVIGRIVVRADHCAVIWPMADSSNAFTVFALARTPAPELSFVPTTAP